MLKNHQNLSFVKGVPYWFYSKIMSKAYDERGGQDECQKFARYNCMKKQLKNFSEDSKTFHIFPDFSCRKIMIFVCFSPVENYVILLSPVEKSCVFCSEYASVNPWVQFSKKNMQKLPIQSSQPLWYIWFLLFCKLEW